MAVRVTAADVKEIIKVDSSIISDANIDVMVLAATQLVDQVAAAGLSDADHLKEIERWLSAHYVAIRDMRSAQERGDEVEQRFQHKVGLNFNVTMYGQQALTLDTTNTLATLQAQAGGVVAGSLEVLGSI